MPFAIGVTYLAPKMGRNPWLWGILMLIPIFNVIPTWIFAFLVAGAILDRLNALNDRAKNVAPFTWAPLPGRPAAHRFRDLPGSGVLLGGIDRQDGVQHGDTPDEHRQAGRDHREYRKWEGDHGQQPDQQIEDGLEDLPIDEQRQRRQENRDQVDHWAAPRLGRASSRG
ncbi:MAG TPA: hypothetical protein VG742_17495 [Dongiaceae bacterium]|nr:hypothetical protein [Dongiaceae bacterium]